MAVDNLLWVLGTELTAQTLYRSSTWSEPPDSLSSPWWVLCCWLSEGSSELSLRISQRNGHPSIRKTMVSILSMARPFHRKARTSKSTVRSVPTFVLLSLAGICILSTREGPFLHRVTVAFFFHGVTLREVNFHVHVMKGFAWIIM